MLRDDIVTSSYTSLGSVPMFAEISQLDACHAQKSKNSRLDAIGEAFAPPGATSQSASVLPPSSPNPKIALGLDLPLVSTI